MSPNDREKNRFSARARRYANVGTQLSGTAARFAGARFFGVPLDRAANALELAAALGGLKGPIMKVAQLLATIPDALPPEYANELIKLQSQAPPMGWAFVKRRMSAELGADWQKKFSELRASSGGGRIARPGASRPRARRQRACLQAAISRHAVGGRSRPQPAAVAVRHPQAFRSGHRHDRDRESKSVRGCARSSTISARPSTSRSIETC